MKSYLYLFSLLVVFLVIGPVNNTFSQQTPVAVDDNASVKKFHILEINVLLNDYDPGGDALEVYEVQNSENGSAELVAGNDSLVAYQSDDFIGLDSIKYKIREKENHANIDSAWVFIEVTGNELPLVIPDTLQLMVGDTLVVDIFDHALDPDGDEFILQKAYDPEHGEADEISDTLFWVSITQNYGGFDSTRMRIREIASNMVVDGYLYYEVTQNTEYPFAVNDTIQAYQGDTCIYNLLLNDYDLQGDELIYEDVDKEYSMEYFDFNDSLIMFVPSAQAATGLYRYFEYQNREDDNELHLSNLADAYVEVLGNPNIPVAVNDTVSILAGYPYEIMVLENDYDINGDPVKISNVTSNVEEYGYYTNNDSVIVLSPFCYLTEDFSFSYRIQETENSAHYSGYATIYVNIIENTNQPIAIDDEITISAYEQDSFNLLLNDQDPNNADISIRQFGSSIDMKFVDVQRFDSIASITIPVNYDGVLNISYRFNQTGNPAMISNWANLTVNVLPNTDSLLAVSDEISLLAGFQDSLLVFENDQNPLAETMMLTLIFSANPYVQAFASDTSVLQMKSEPTVSGEYELAYFVSTPSSFPFPKTGAKVKVTVNSRNLIDSLDVNNICATFSAFNLNFWDPYLDEEGYSKFEAPKGSGTSSIFSSSIWIGGVSDDTLHVAAERYRQEGEDFWPGPVSDEYLPENYTFYGVWKVNKSEIDYHIANYTNPDYQPILPILSWPGNGNTILGQAEQLAPYYDSNSDLEYNCMDGDYPMIRGDQALYFIFNDGQDIHTETEGNPMNVEIHGMAYAFDNPSDSAFFNTIFVHYDIYNRSGKVYDSTYFGLFTDFDLGNPNDDFVGCDVGRGYAYVYNGDDYDENTEEYSGYGTNPPLQSMVILGGPEMENDNLDNPAGECNESVNGMNFGDGIVDNERQGMTRFSFFRNGGGSATSDPQVAPEYYNFLKGLWNDNTPVLYGGNGHYIFNTVGPECSFMFPGASDPLNWGTSCEYPNGGFNQNDLYWTYESAGNLPFDIRGLSVTGPFNFDAGEVQSVDIAYVFAQDYNLDDDIEAMDIMNERIDTLRNRVNNGGIIYFEVDDTSIPEFGNNIGQINIYPNPVQNNTINVDLTRLKPNRNGTYIITDLLGRIQLNGSLETGRLNEISIPSLSPGVYMMMISTGTEITSHKIVIGN